MGKEYSKNEEELLEIGKLYIGKKVYHPSNGSSYIECDDNIHVGYFDCNKSEFRDVLNYESYQSWSNKNYCYNNLGRHLIMIDGTLSDYLKEKGLEFDHEIKRKDLREIIEPLNVRDEILKRIVSLSNKAETSMLDDKSKCDIKKILLKCMDEYVANISNSSSSLALRSIVIQSTNKSLDVVEGMIPVITVEEIKTDVAKLKRNLFNELN